MVIDQFHVVGIISGPTETNAPLIVYPDAELAFTIALQHFKPVARRYFQVIKPAGMLDQQQLPPRRALQVGTQAAHRFTVEDLLCTTITKAADHAMNVLRYV